MDRATVLLLIVGLFLIGVPLFLLWRSKGTQPGFVLKNARGVPQGVAVHRSDGWLDPRARWVSGYYIRPLSEKERAQYSTAWRQIQSVSVRDPATAVRDAEVLVTDLMMTRGYPMTDFERRARDLSVAHAAVVDHYRAAHRVGAHHLAVTTGEFRQALGHYRALVDALLDRADSRQTA